MRLAISITAHERIRVLERQVRNIRLHCRDPLVILHLNADFARRLRAVPEEGAVLERLRREPGVWVNPAHLATRWAHLFHAHVANMRLLRDRGEAHSHLLLLSSADLFLRRGIEERLAALDASAPAGPPIALDAPPSEGGAWMPRVAADGRLRAMLSARGLSTIRHDLHEGSFYRRELAEAMLAILERHIPDWEYDDAYPKEEFFLPSLLQAFPGIRTGPRVAHALVIGSGVERDRAAVACALEELCVARRGEEAPVDGWVRDALAASPPGDDPLAGRFVLSRVSRHPADPLRQIVAMAGEADAEAMRAHGRRLGGWELAQLERPGAKAQIIQRPAPCGAALRAALGRAARLDLLPPPWLAAVEAAEVALASCDGGFSPPAALAGGLLACGRCLPAGGTLEIAGGNALQMAMRAPGGTAGEDALGFLWFDLPAEALREGWAIACRPLPGGRLPARIWLELHWEGGKEVLGLGEPLEGAPGEAILPFPPELRFRGPAEPPARLQLYLGEVPGGGLGSLHRLEALAD